MTEYKNKPETFDFDDVLCENLAATAVCSLAGGAVRVRTYSENLPGMLGFPREEFDALVREDALSLVVEADRARILVMIDRAAAAKKSLNTIVQVRHRQYGTTWLHLSACLCVCGSEILLKAVFMPRAAETMLYQDIADKATNGSYVVTDEWDVLYVNHQLQLHLNSLGLTELLGKKCYSVIQNRTTPCPNCVLKAPGPRLLTADRSKRVYKTTSHRLLWNGANANVIYINDVTEQRAAINEIERIYNNIPGAVFRCCFDEKWTVLSANDGLFAFLGYTREEFMAMGNCMAAVIYPDDLRVMGEKIGRQLAEGKQTAENENRLVCKDGTVKWISIKAQLLHEENGEQGFYCVFVDITKQKQETERVEKEQMRYRMLFDMLGIAYWEWSAGNTYHSEKYNEYAISELDTSKIGAPCDYDVFVHPDDAPLSEEYMATDGIGETRRSVVMRAKMKDGSYRWTEMVSLTVKSADGTLQRIISVMRDVDATWREQKKQLEEALEKEQHANQAKTDFLSRVSHDMRTPLNGILGLTELLKEKVDDENALADLQQLEMSGRYLLNLINDTLDVSKIESGKLELHPVVCDGRTVFNNIVSLVRPNLQAKNIHLNVQAENLPFTLLYIDVGRVEQVVMNILGNAIKFTPEGGSIDFEMTNVSVENGVIIDKMVIRDTGIGMSRAFLPHLFEPFRQEYHGRTSSYQGTGLGMTITKEILDLMGGTIAVESELGRGTTFTCTLPMPVATEQQLAERKEIKVIAATDEALKGRRVLLCEDHPLNADIAIRLLTRKGMLVERAENGSVGVAMFRASTPGYYDVILMDIRMPVMDGLDATRAIRALPREDAKRIPIVAITANAFDEDVQLVKQAGMDAHMSKPINTDKLYATLEEMLNLNRTFRRRMILVVDDVELNRKVICNSLQSEFTMLEACSGVEAMEILEKQRGIDAVITDIQMPEMDGVELIRNIRNNKNYRHIVIIANTQFGDPTQEEQLLALGADDFVYKPTTPKIVEMRVKNALKKM